MSKKIIPLENWQTRNLSQREQPATAPSATENSSDDPDELKREVNLLEKELLEIKPVIQRLKEYLKEIKRKVEDEFATQDNPDEGGSRGGQSLMRVASMAVVAVCVFFSFHGETITLAVTKTFENLPQIF